MPENLEFLMGKISGQLEGLDTRMDDLKSSIGEMATAQRGQEARLNKLERREAHRSGMLAAIAAAASLVGGAFVTFLSRKM